MTTESEEIHVPGEDPGRQRPALRPLVTLLCWAWVGVSVLLMVLSYVAGDPLDFLEDPVAAVRHVGDRSLDLNEAIRYAPPWERALYSVLGGSPDEHMRTLADAYSRTAEYTSDPEEADLMWARQAILLAESKEWERAEEVFDRMSASSSTEAFIGVMSYAYGDGSDAAVPSGEMSFGLLVLGPETASSWSRDRLAIRIAERSGGDESTGHADATLHRGQRLLARSRALDLAYAGVLLGGLAVIVRRRSLFRRGFEAAGGLTVAPWPFRYGVDVLARCFVCGGLVLLMAVGASKTMYVFGSLLSGLPMLILAQYYLFGPEGDRIFKSLGLGLRGVSWKTLLLFTAGLIFVSQFGVLLIMLLMDALGVDARLEEGIEELILFGRPFTAALLAFDGIVSAPVIEEIGFRGLLYVTLRARFRPVASACMSAALFGALHLYSLAGLLTIFWTGFILALAYERCRSLWPCILAHAFNNLAYFAELALLYR